MRLAIEGGWLPRLLDEWDREAMEFRTDRKPYLLYCSFERGHVLDQPLVVEIKDAGTFRGHLAAFDVAKLLKLKA